MERLDGMERSEKASAALTITTSAVLLTMLARGGQPTRGNASRGAVPRVAARPEASETNGT